jgi:ribonuclease J
LSANGTLRILPLGGLGEIGKNMTVVEYDGRIVVVDTGLMFPTPDQLGVDLVLPDFAYLRDRAADIEAIVLTHGHEDHVGSLPFVLREIGPDHRPPIYGGPLTVGLVRSKLDEHRLTDSVQLEDVGPGQVFDAGPFSVEPIRLSHSIPDSLGIALTCDLGTTLLTGDYKFDQTPVDGQPADMARLAELGREGLLLLCGDSTNVDRPGVALSESSIGPHLEEAIARCRGRVVVTCFASNVHRVQQVVDAAAADGRKVSLVGRSMRKNVNIARGLGHIDIPEGMLVGVREIEDFPDHKIVVISTGSQGEPLSALRRMAHGDHPQVELREHDTVLFSATPIPGNERAVNETINRIYQLGADVVTARDAPIHASGHGYAEELKMMINLTQPEYVMPVHGDFRRMRLHRELAESLGVPRENGFIAANGVPLEIDSHGARLGEREQAGMIFVDGMEVGDVNDVALRDRRMLSADGIFIVVATVSEQDGRSVAPPELIFRGVPFLEGAGDELLDDLRKAVDESLARSAKEEISEVDLIQAHLHDDVQRFVYDRLKRRPMVLPVVVEV